MVGNVFSTVFAFVLSPRTSGDWINAKLALYANAIWLGGFTVWHLVRTPWLLDTDREETGEDLETSLRTEQQKNQRPDIQGEVLNAFFDLPYRQQGQPAIDGCVLAIEVNVWNARPVPTTVKQVWLKLTHNGLTSDAVELSLMDVENVQIGATRLDDLRVKISSQNPIRYSIHESGWLLFYAKELTRPASTQIGSAHIIPGVRLRLGFVDASGTTHQVEQTCDIHRRSLERNLLNSMKQFTIAV